LLKHLNRFRWAFCQLETLRHCLPPSVRRTLDELPESLDETYERLLKEIKKPNRDHARRLLQCLVVAIRPLRVEELAEVLAVDFDDVEGIPKLNPDWRWEDEEQALLTSCSSLITIVETGYFRVVQFSHFSVKEFLTSTRLATSSGDISRYHIDLEPAHTILAQACMGILLQTDDCVEENGIGTSASLAGYAVEHWVTHAQFERVSSFLQKAMEYFFDLDKPYIAAWLELQKIDIPSGFESSSLYFFGAPPTSSATPLYYASLCGFQDLVEHLVVKHPGHVNTRGGFYVTPMVAALAGRHFQTAKFLHHNGAHLKVRGKGSNTLLHFPAWYGDVETVQVLLDYKVDVNTQGDGGWAPLHCASGGDDPARIHNVVQSWPGTVQLLLEHGADVNGDLHYWTPLHQATQNTSVEIVRILLEHGADPNARTTDGSTPLHLVAQYQSGAFRSSSNLYEIALVLLERGANVAAKDDEGRTPLYRAARNWSVEPVRMLLEHGADLNARTNNMSTPLHAAAANKTDEVLRLLLKRDANVDAKDDDGWTPLHEVAAHGRDEVVRMMLKRGANVGAKDYGGRTPFQLASVMGNYATMKLLSEYGGKDVLYMIPDSTSSLCLPW
jgi:ankyrin repeat protein